LATGVLIVKTKIIEEQNAGVLAGNTQPAIQQQ
jgi:hypothetical protein